MTSPDGATWTRHDTAGREQWQSIAFGDHGWDEKRTFTLCVDWCTRVIAHAPDGTIVIVGSTIGSGEEDEQPAAAFARSTDGAQWTVRDNLGAIFSVPPNTLIHDCTRFVSTDPAGEIGAGVHGVQWTLLKTFSLANGQAPAAATSSSGWRASRRPARTGRPGPCPRRSWAAMRHR